MREAAYDRAVAAGLVPEADLPELPPLPSDLVPPVRATAAQLKHYDEQGYVLFPSLIDRATVAELQRAVDAMVEHRIGSFSYEPSDPSLIQRINGTEQCSPAFQRLLRNEALCGAIAQLIGPSFRHSSVKLNFKPAGVGSAVEWHQDWAFYPHTNGSVLAAGIFIDDIDGSNGPTMVVPASHRGPIFDHHTNGAFVGGMEADCGCDFASAVQLTGPAGSVSMHHVRQVHGSDHNRSTRDRRIIFIECMAADAWPLLTCPEFADDNEPRAENHDDQAEEGPPWYHHAPAVFDGVSALRSTGAGSEETLELTLPATATMQPRRALTMMGDGVSAPRLEPAPVRLPLPRLSAHASKGLPGGGLYATHTLLKRKSFGSTAKAKL